MTIYKLRALRRVLVTYNSWASQEIPHIYGTQRMITAFTRSCHLSLSRSIQSTPTPTPLQNDFLKIHSHCRTEIINKTTHSPNQCTYRLHGVDLFIYSFSCLSDDIFLQVLGLHSIWYQWNGVERRCQGNHAYVISRTIVAFARRNLRTGDL
jgi:hypothetical protein